MMPIGVLVRPLPHSEPGSNPTWPIESMMAVPLRRTKASSPLNQPAPFVWSAWARIVAPAEDWATTWTSPSATEAVRAMGIAQLDRVLTEQQIAAIVAFLDTLTGTYRSDVVKPATDTPHAAKALP